MSSKRLPLSDEKMIQLAMDYPTPFHLYDERGIRRMPKLSSELWMGRRV